jgi:hypothetical protein
LIARAAPLAVSAFVALLALGALGALHPPQARADGDPASDVLLGTDVFYPFEPVSHSLTVTLSKEAAEARKLKAPIKVALIPTAIDLGTITALFGQPQSYADFLAQEISFVGKAPLLIVMPNGYGTNDMPAAAVAVVKALPKPAGKTANDLAQAAIAAVPKILAAEGHPLPGTGAGAGVPGAGGGGSGSSGGGGSAGLIIGLIAAGVLGAGAIVAARLRRRTGRT